MTVTRIATDRAPAAVGPYAQGVSTGDGAGSLVFVSGQVPLDPATGTLVEGDVQAQAEQVLKNVGAILAQAGLGYDDVVKTTVLLADIADFAAVNEVYARYFQGVSTGQGAGSLVFVSGQVPLEPATGALVEGDVQAQAEQVLKNVGAILAEAGLGYGDVVKTTVLLADIADFAAVNEVYARYFTGEALPARAAFAVAGLPLGARVEIEAVAARS